MALTFLSDEIVKPTELRNSQKKWLQKAVKEGITIPFGKDNLALINRALLRNLFAEKHYAEQIIIFLAERLNQESMSIFPWLNDLDESEKEEFNKELLICFRQCIANDNWTEMDYLLEDWRATAQANKNPELDSNIAVQKRGDNYVHLS